VEGKEWGVGSWKSGVGSGEVGSRERVESL